MATKKEIYIAGRRIGLGTGVKGSPEVKRSTTQTFDGAKSSGVGNIPHSLEISKLQTDDFEEYMSLIQLMDTMLTEKKTITIAETIVNENGEQFTIYRHYLGCLVDGNEYEMNAEDMTAETLKFMAESMKPEGEQ